MHFHMDVDQKVALAKHQMQVELQRHCWVNVPKQSYD